MKSKLVEMLKLSAFTLIPTGITTIGIIAIIQQL